MEKLYIIKLKKKKKTWSWKIAEKRQEVKGKREKEIYTKLNSEFQTM